MLPPRYCIVIFVLLVAHWWSGTAAPAKGDDWDELNSQFNSLHEADNYREEEAVCRQLLEVANRENNQVRVAAALGFLAIAADDQARYNDAVSYNLRSLELWKKAKGAENEIVAEVLNNRANTYINQGRYAEAEQELRQSLAMRQKILGAQHASVAQSLNNLGILLYRQGNYDKAAALYKQALAIDENVLGPNDPETAMVLDDLAIVYDDQGLHSEAEPLYKRALGIRERTLGPNHPDAANTLNNLAELYREQGRYSEAEPLYRRALAIKEKQLGADHLKVADTLANLALMYANDGKYSQAEPLYRRALTIQEKQLGSEHPTVANSLNNLGALYNERKEYEAALPLYQRALAIREKQLGPNHPDVAGSLMNLAGVYVDQGNFAPAGPLLDRAIGILENAHAVADFLFRAYDYRADLDWQTNRREKAVADLATALSISEQMRGNVAGAENERAVFFSRYSGAFERMVDWQNQLGHLDESLAAMERSRARTLLDQMKVQGTDLLAGLAADEATRLRVRETAAKAKVASLESELDVLPKRTDFTEVEKKAEERRLTQQLSVARNEQVEAYRDIRNASPACRLMVGQDFKPVSLEQLQAWVKEQDALLLQYFLGDKDGYLFITSGDEQAQLVKLEITKQQAEELRVGTHDSTNSSTGELDAGPLTAKRAKAALTLGGQDLPQALSQPDIDRAVIARLAALWKLLIPEGQREALISGKYKRLILILDAALVNLPFETLVVELQDNPIYFLDRGPPIIEGPSATLLYNLSQRETAQHPSAKEPVLTVGNPKYPALRASGSSASRSATELLSTFRPGSRYASRGSLKPLPNTGTEVAWVAEAFTKLGRMANKLLQADATEANIRSQIVGREIVHLACHGLVDSEHGNFFGALALTPGAKASTTPSDDGFLTLPEIYDLNLKGCELSILSACQTNYGPEQRGEGVWALSRGFLVAGSRRVVASNWLVDDEAAANLIYLFCNNIAQQEKAEVGRRKAESQESRAGAHASNLAAGLAPLPANTTVDYSQALHDAKRWVRNQEKWHSPYY